MHEDGAHEQRTVMELVVESVNVESTLSVKSPVSVMFDESHASRVLSPVVVKPSRAQCRPSRARHALSAEKVVRVRLMLEPKAEKSRVSW